MSYLPLPPATDIATVLYVVYGTDWRSMTTGQRGSKIHGTWQSPRLLLSTRNRHKLYSVNQQSKSSAYFHRILHIRRWIWAPPPSSGGNWSSLSDETCLENRTEYRFACRIFAKNERHELYLHRYYSLAKERRTAPTTILTVHKSEPS